MASRAVSLSWWSYRKSLSKKSKASGEIKCWFSLCTKRSHLLRECLEMEWRLGTRNKWTSFPKSFIPAEDIIEPWIKFNLILVKILKKFFCTQNFGDADQLVVVIMTMEEGLFAKYHWS